MSLLIRYILIYSYLYATIWCFSTTPNRRVQAGQPKKGESDAEGHGTVVRRADPLCDAARLWRGVRARPAPGGPGGLWLCALSDTGRGALHVCGPREVSHARGWGDRVQGVCRALWDPHGSANEFPAGVSAHVRVAHVCRGAGGHAESVAPVETCLGRMATLEQGSSPLPSMVVSCQMDTFFRLGWSGAHNTIHAREITEMLQATPQRFGPRVDTGAAADKATELCNPTHRLAQRGWTVRRGRTVMDGTIQRLPFLDVQQHITRHLGHCPRQHNGIKHPPGNDAVERQTALQALVGGQLARFDATAAFQNPMPDFNAPATRVPLDTFAGVLDAVHGDRGQQQPLDRLHLRRRLNVADLHGPQPHCGQ